MLAAGWRRSLVSLLSCGLFLVFLLSWKDARTVAILVAIALPFYGLLFAVTLYLHHPRKCAVAWLGLRLFFLLGFLVAGGIRGGDEGFMLMAWNFAADIPFLPILESTSRLLTAGIDFTIAWLRQTFGFHPTVLRWVPPLFSLAVYGAFYGGGGYLAGRWAEKRVSDRR